jgi:phospholipid N-methyltransferase
MLGSFIPSSRFLVEHLLEQVDWQQARVLVEYGPGVGNITGEILRRMRRDAKLVVIEMNREFVDFLRAAFNDERLRVVHGSAADVRKVLHGLGLPRADCIISGIPYSTMPGHMRDAILHSSRQVLQANGSFLIYQFTGAVRPHLERVFGAVRQEFEPLNILPARLFYCVP